MKQAIKNITVTGICMSILAIIVGIIMMFYPGESLVALGITLAIYLIIHGITLIVMDIRAWSLALPFNGFLRGIVYIILGIFLLKGPESIAVALGIALGVWVIMASIDNIKLALALRGTGAPSALMIIIDVIDIIIGVIMVLTPVLSSVYATIFAGAAMVVHSIINIVNMISVKKNIADVEKAISDSVAIGK